MLDVGCWMLDVGCWMLDVVGCWLLAVGCFRSARHLQLADEVVAVGPGAGARALANQLQDAL